MEVGGEFTSKRPLLVPGESHADDELQNSAAASATSGEPTVSGRGPAVGVTDAGPTSASTQVFYDALEEETEEEEELVPDDGVACGATASAPSSSAAATHRSPRDVSAAMFSVSSFAAAAAAAQRSPQGYAGLSSRGSFAPDWGRTQLRLGISESGVWREAERRPSARPAGASVRSPRLRYDPRAASAWHPAPAGAVGSAAAARSMEEASDSDMMIEMRTLADTASATAAQAAANVATAATAAASASARATATAATMAAGAAAVSVVAVATAGAAITRGTARRLSSVTTGATAEPLLQSASTTEPSSVSPAADSDGPPLQSPRGGDRECFICLMDGDKDTPLVSCCTTCYARTHLRCWREWRNNQRITALRSRLLGLRMQTNHLLRCTICKSGTAMVAGEEEGLQWMNELLSGGNEGAGGDENAARTIQFGAARRDDSDEDRDAQLEDLVDMRTCSALAVYLGVLLLVLIVACTVIVTKRFYAGDVVLCSIIALYELSVLQIIVLAVARRRGAALAEASAASAAGEQPGESGRQDSGPVAQAIALAAASRTARAAAVGTGEP